MKLYTLIFTVLVLSINFVYSETKFYTQLSSNTVLVGDRLEVSFVLENVGGSNFKSPSFKGFSVLSGPNRSQSTQWVNGVTNSSTTFSYILSADVAGKFTINSAYITVDGKRMHTKPVTVTVVKGQKQSKDNNNDEINLNNQAEKIIRKNLFLKLYVDKRQAYEGESIVATYKLYVHPQLQLINLGQPTMPTFNGFWTQDLGIKELKFHTETINGIPYRVADLKKVVLLAQQSGDLNIEPMKIESVVRLAVQGRRRRSHSPFDDPFFDDFFNRNYRDFKFTITSQSSKIHIKPLSPNPPDYFAGAVGDLNMETTIDKNKAKTGDAITLKIKISGKGNLKLIDALPLDLPPDIDVFDPKITDNISVSTSGMSGSLTFEYYLIPRTPGKYKIKPVVFTYFDLSKKKYKILTSDEFVISVTKGLDNSSTVVSGVNKKDVKYLGKDIRFIKTNWSDIGFGKSRFSTSIYFYLLLILPVIIFILIFFYTRRREELNRDAMLMRNRKANAVAKKRLTKARQYIGNNNENEFYEEISKVLTGYTADKLSILPSEFTRETAKNKLIQKKVNDDIIERLLSTINYCESVRFAPSTEKLSMKEVYNKASKIITDLEGIL
jgi:uncharacterized membrane protein